VNKKFFAYILSFAVLCGSTFIVDAQKAKPKPKTAVASKTAVAIDPMMAALPPSDVVVAIDVKRMLNEFVPKLLSESPDKLAKFNEQLDNIKAKMGGLDIRQLERVVAGLHFVRTAPKKINVETVLLAKSSYPAETLIMGAKLVSKEKFKMERHAGKTVTIFDLSALKEKAAEVVKDKAVDPNQPNNQSTATSLMDTVVGFILGQNLSEVAVTSIDDKTLAVGKLSSVKAALDSVAAKKTGNAALNELATKNPNAVVSFGGNVPTNVAELIGVEDDLANQINSIKQAYGSIGMNATNYELALTARALTAKDAKALFDLLEVLKSLGTGFLQNRNDDLSKIGAGLIGGLKTKNDGKDIHLIIEMKQSDVNGLLKLF
jgi:hypothetical protein